MELEKIIENAVIIEKASTDSVCLGTTVKIKYIDDDDDELEEYMIVGSKEADPSNNKISNESPIGIALLGDKKGATVEVNAPAGIIKYEIRKITK